MSDTHHVDLENCERHFGADPSGPSGPSGDAKKTDAMHEMLHVRNLAHRTYYQCLCIFVIIGITLVVVIA